MDASHALAQKQAAVASEVEAETMFTRCAYEKGASVLRMLHAHMLRTPDHAGVFDTKAWQLRRSRKLLEAAGNGAPHHRAHACKRSRVRCPWAR